MKKNSILNLSRIGFVPVAYPHSVRTAVSKAVVSWKAFCAIPEEIRVKLPYSNNTAGVGYELKKGQGLQADRKENFDLTIPGIDWLQKQAPAKESAVRAFLDDAVALVSLIKPMVVDFARQVEAEYKLVGFTDEVEASEDSFFVRFIHYFGDCEIGKEIATAHADQSGFTLHLFESDPGLQCLSLDKKWMNMPVRKGQTVIIPSMQLQLRSQGKLTALCHRVIATSETARDGRYSAVCFVQLKHTPKYNKEKYGRLQEKEPGFNYAMAIGDFSKFFKK